MAVIQLFFYSLTLSSSLSDRTMGVLLRAMSFGIGELMMGGCGLAAAAAAAQKNMGTNGKSTPHMTSPRQI